MASGSGNGEERTDRSHGPRECMACRGTGRVISNLGGTPSTVQCPWCGGSGVRAESVDAQAHWQDKAPQESAPGEAPSGSEE